MKTLKSGFKYSLHKLSAILVLSFIGLYGLSAQTESQVKAELEKRGIDTFEEIQAELRKRGMTEADARRQAKLYGLDYDEYIRKYVFNQKSTNQLNDIGVQQITLDTVNYLTQPTDSLSQISETINSEPTDEGGLPYFGYATFQNDPFENQLALVSNIDPGYIIGPGDELRIYLWGEAEFQFEGKVDVNGNVFIPNVGQVFVSGTSYKDLNERLKGYLSRFYSGLTKVPQKIFLDVSLSKLRPIRIMVMGESVNPGSHIVNSFATTVNSIYASGGIKTSGSLREIKVFRNNRLTSTIDLYDYLIKGAVSEDLRLVSNDVIFIQSRLNTVTLEGEVNNEAIYELKDNEGLIELISFAGGLKPAAYTETVTIRRIKPLVNRSADDVFDREIITINYNELIANGVNFRVQDGDIIEFGTVLEKFDNVVSVSGSVFRPGDYQLVRNMTVKDLLEQSGGLKPNSYLDKVDLYRKDRDGSLGFKSIPLREVLSDGPGSVYLQADDSLRVYNLDELKSLESVSIEGFLSEPKTILWRENLTVYDLIFMSADVEDLEYQSKILTSRADLLRFQEEIGQYKSIPFDLDSVLDNKFNIVLKPKDRVVLYSRSITEELDMFASISGAVKQGGKFMLTDSMTVEDLILQAGGFVAKSFRDSVTVTTENFDFNGNKIATANRVLIDMNYLTGNSDKPTSPFFLKNNDNVSVDFIPGSSEQRRVRLTGEIKYPGLYSLTSKSETLSQVLTRAGGLSQNVYLPGAKFYRSGQQLSYSFADLIMKNNANFDIILQDNDSIYFPESTYTVQVEGEVVNPSLQKFVDNQKLRKYVRNSGGRTRNADKMLLISPDGYTRKVGWLSNPKVLDGSRIVLPAKPVKEPREPGKFLENFGTVAAIISSTLTTLFLVQRLN